MRNLSDAALQLELEKAQRLVRMIEAEIRWRRTLELEEEVIIERELAMRRANGLGFLLETQPALPQESCFSLLGLNAFNMAPPPRPPEINAAIMKRESEGSKEKLIILPKPNQTRYEGKRKIGVEVKNSENDELELEFKKKAKVVHGWRCEVCNILTTSEKGLNDHFKGKKHTAKEKSQSRKIDSQKSTNLSLKSVASSCSTMEAKPEMEEEEEEEVDNNLKSGVQSVKNH